jgi:hypothetical protein
MKEDEALVLLLLGGSGEHPNLPCPLHNPTALPLLVLDLLSVVVNFFFTLALGLGLGLAL